MTASSVRYVGILAATGSRGIEEQLSGACTTEIAAFDEFTALLTDGALTSGYEHIIFDTAPTGHTIRLLQRPGAWSGFLEQGEGDASCLGPLAGLEKQRAQIQGSGRALADPSAHSFDPGRPRPDITLREVARTQEELAKIGLSQQIWSSTASFLEVKRLSIHWRRPSMIVNKRPCPIFLTCSRASYDQVALKPFNLVGWTLLRQLLTETVSREIIAVRDRQVAPSILKRHSV